MIRWSDLTPDEQERWLTCAEMQIDEPVSWGDVKQAPREYWLKIVRLELLQNLWEDKSLEERRAATAEIDRHDQELTQKKEEALQLICRDLRVPYAPGETDAPFWELARLKYGRTGGPRPGNQAIPLKRRLRFAVAFMSALKKCRHIADIKKRENAALAMLRETQRWGQRQPKGRPQKRTLRNMHDLLREARAHPPIRDTLEGKTTPLQCKRLLAVYEIMLPVQT